MPNRDQEYGFGDNRSWTLQKIVQHRQLSGVEVKEMAVPGGRESGNVPMTPAKEGAGFR